MLACKDSGCLWLRISGWTVREIFCGHVGTLFKLHCVDSICLFPTHPRMAQRYGSSGRDRVGTPLHRCFRGLTVCEIHTYSLIHVGCIWILGQEFGLGVGLSIFPPPTPQGITESQDFRAGDPSEIQQGQAFHSWIKSLGPQKGPPSFWACQSHLRNTC